MPKTSRFRPRASGFVLLMACLSAWAGAQAAQPSPEAGNFLVATGGTPGVFSRSVVFLIASDAHGALGVIVNRPTKVPLAKVLVHPDSLEGRSDPLYFGGPVALDHLTLLIRAKTKPPDAVHVIGDIYASGSMKALLTVAGGKLAGATFRGYAGYAGWAPGQLDGEIARGGWKILPATDADVFSTDPADLWHKLIRRQPLQLVETLRTGSHRRCRGVCPEPQTVLSSAPSNRTEAGAGVPWTKLMAE